MSVNYSRFMAWMRENVIYLNIDFDWKIRKEMSKFARM